MPRPLQGQPPMARPVVGATDCGQGPMQGAVGCPQVVARNDSNLQGQQPPTGTVGCNQPAGAAVTRGYTVASPQGQQPPMGIALCRPTPARGDQLQGTRKGLPPAANPSPASSRGGDSGTVKAKRARASICKKMIMPLRIGEILLLSCFTEFSKYPQ
ncbi:hypothetical protein B296_00019895 [Ensete ventricosum]|uniref:Uncharacterized protein n=1 Tax=Ensete ventricosum TaxID=4639 RepID=A0A426X033_ENSVE|nr:hypothetical protein B296_00019895 [Ensete ventricosum]